MSRIFSQLNDRDMQMLLIMSETPQESRTIDELADNWPEDSSMPSTAARQHNLTTTMTKLCHLGFCDKTGSFLSKVSAAKLSTSGMATVTAYESVVEYLQEITKSDIRLFLALYRSYSRRGFTLDEALRFLRVKTALKATLKEFKNMGWTGRPRNGLYHFTAEARVGYGLLSNPHLHPFLFPQPSKSLRVIHYLLTEGKPHTIREIVEATDVTETTVLSTITHSPSALFKKGPGDTISVDHRMIAESPRLCEQLVAHGLRTPFEE